MAYIGSTPTTQSFISGTDYFSGNGSTIAFTLSRAVVSVNDIEAVVNNVVQQPNTAYTISGTTITFTSAPSSGTSNIYVRYLSTTTQSITPSQNSVGYNQLTTDVQNDLGISFKNRIINGDMRIDQRNAGASVSIQSVTGYTLDRWNTAASQNSKFSVQQNAGSVTPPAGFTNYLGCTSSAATSLGSTDYFNLLQTIEGFNCADLGWGTASAKTVTLSFWVRSSLTGSFGGVFQNNIGTRFYPFSYTISSANTWEQKTITVVGDTSGTWATNNTGSIQIRFGLGVGSTYSGTAGSWSGNTYASSTGATSVVGTNGATFYITGVQLEVGTQATTFDYRSYGTELALCQRYCYQLTHEGPATIPVCSGTMNSASDARGLLSFPVTMRAAPSMTSSTGTNYYGYDKPAAGIINFNSIYSAYERPNAALLYASVTGGTTGYGIVIYITNVGGFIRYSAEL